MRGVVRDHSNEAEELNSDNQLFRKGVDILGKKLRPLDAPYSTYAPSTKRTKRRKGQPTNRITLKDSGTFHDSFAVKTSATFFVITARRVVKGFDVAAQLAKRYGKVLGLTNPSLKIFTRLIKPDFVREFKKIF